ncbi:MAG: hypothetical protein KAQ83_02960 [Nanoarchaeota archaeon]|nr:hypothetical protein [Nanoarchaeota archaeon]
MKNILILGALPKEKEDEELYNVIIEVCEKFAMVKSPIDTFNFNGSAKEKYERAFNLVKKADLVIGEQSKPSTGQGMEVRECAILGKPLIVVAKEGSKVSGLVKGCPVLKKIIYYSDLENLKKKLEEVLNG